MELMKKDLETKIGFIKEDALKKIKRFNVGFTVYLDKKVYMISSDFYGNFNFITPKIIHNGIDYCFDFFNFEKSEKVEEKNIFKEIEKIIFEKEKKLDTKGSIYLVTDGKYTKIGATSYNVKKRLNELQTGNAKELKIVYDYKVKNKISTECFLHNKFKDKRILGEWFDLSFKDIEYIIKNKPTVEIEKDSLTSSDKESIINCINSIKNEILIYKKKIYYRKNLKIEEEMRKQEEEMKKHRIYIKINNK